jgi:hypothetical protein
MNSQVDGLATVMDRMFGILMYADIGRYVSAVEADDPVAVAEALRLKVKDLQEIGMAVYNAARKFQEAHPEID